ncbi:Cell division protein ftsA [Capnocytophaga canis]|uniref:Cell division protein FtsA n=1 Tax=Capnocytophaga canis TaxID=1848903 RepID=A0A0B7I019_9FLAO|nr:Cell division protein ftsA [Capnocytophaga canis]CEN44490.1 Cell division protein ftsA [Capnocytophaga canis]CEN52892.1 Cell division protein ftsA [Capnocytophaga canis]
MKNALNDKKYYVGLDIGTTKIVAMVGTRNEYGKIQILGYGQSKSDGITKGVVQNIIKTTQSILEAIADAKTKTGLEDIQDVMVGIAGQHILSRSHSDYIIRPDADKLIDIDDLEQLKQQVYRIGLTPGQRIIHVLPQEYRVDDQEPTSDPIGMIGSRLDASFHLVIGQVSSSTNIERCVTSSGLNVVDLTLEPLASAEAVLTEEEKDVGVALVDIGGGTTDVAIFKDGIIRHTAVIPLGGNIITEDIKEGCAILSRQAEKLKVEFGSAWPGENRDNEIVAISGIIGREPKEISLKNLSKIIHARVSEIIGMVYNVIKNYGHEENKKKLIAGIVLTGGGSQLKHIVQLTEYITGMDVRIGYPNQHLTSKPDAKISSPVYATSIGLVMSAIAHESEKLIMQQLEEKKKQEAEEKEREQEALKEQVKQAQLRVALDSEEVRKEEEAPKEKSGGFWGRVRNLKDKMDSFFSEDYDDDKDYK